MSERISKIFFFVSFLFFTTAVVFLYGFVVAERNIWPKSVLKEVETMTRSLKKYHRIAPNKLFGAAPEDAPGVVFKIYDNQQMQKGFYAFMGWDASKSKNVVWLYDEQGELHHTWPLDYDSLAPEENVDLLGGGHEPHGLDILADGSIIVTFDTGYIMPRLDSCGKPIWVKKGVFHHSVAKAEDGTYWTWRGEGSPNVHYNYLVNFEPDSGSTIKEISLVDHIIKRDRIAPNVFGVRRDYKFQDFEKTPDDKKEALDIFHPNDVDVLHSDIADKFHQFKAGDLLINFRNVHLVCVLDPISYRLKWCSNGPWRFQHDPDFTRDGKISVFNNNTGHARSEIIKMDPRTYDVSNELKNGNLRFYSKGMGKHQYLPNENVLITAAHEGRILVVSKDGNKIMEFNNMVEDLDRVNAHVSNALWLPTDYFSKFPHCSESTH